MTISPPIPVTCVTGFLGAGKTSTILGLLNQLPKDYKCVLLKNEYGDVEVDSLLAKQNNITGVSEITNGCLCCTMVGLMENALIEIRDKYRPDRIIIESSGSAFPATLALQIRQLEPEGFKLDGVVTVIDCVNFRGYEDNSPSAKLQAQYTDLLLLSKHQLCSERDLDILLDHLYELNDGTPHIKVGAENPLRPELVFGLDTTLFKLGEDERDTWAAIGGSGKHTDEVDTRSVWRGGAKPSSKHKHANGESCKECSTSTAEPASEPTSIEPIERATLEAALSKLALVSEIYRVKGILRFPSTSPETAYDTHILNWAFGRHELTHAPGLDASPDLEGVSVRLTIMGERGEVARPARALAAALGGAFA